MANTASDAKLQIRMEVTQAKMEKQLRKIAKSANDNAARVEKRFEKTNRSMQKNFSNSAKAISAVHGPAWWYR